MNNVFARTDRLHFHLYKLFMNNPPGFYWCTIGIQQVISSSYLCFIEKVSVACKMDVGAHSFLAHEHLCAYTSRAQLSLSSPLSRNPFWLWGNEAYATVYSFEHKLIFHLPAWKDPVHEPWLIISSVHHTVIRGKHLENQEQQNEDSEWKPCPLECLQLLPGFSLIESAWAFWFFFWLTQVGNGWGSTKNSRISRYNTLGDVWVSFQPVWTHGSIPAICSLRIWGHAILHLHPCPSNTISPFIPSSIFLHTQASFLHFIGSQHSPQLPSEHTFLLLRRLFRICFKQSSLCCPELAAQTSLDCFTACDSLPFSVLCPKSVTPVQDTWNRCQLISLAGRLLALPYQP